MVRCKVCGSVDDDSPVGAVCVVCAQGILEVAVTHPYDHAVRAAPVTPLPTVVPAVVTPPRTTPWLVLAGAFGALLLVVGLVRGGVAKHGRPAATTKTFEAKPEARFPAKTFEAIPEASRPAKPTPEADSSVRTPTRPPSPEPEASPREVAPDVHATPPIEPRNREAARPVDLQGWAIRISSDRELPAAREIEATMHSAGFEATIVEHDRYFCVVVGNYADKGAAESAGRIAVQSSPRGDRPVPHLLSSWCPRQFPIDGYPAADGYLRCVEYSVRVSSSSSLADAQSDKHAVEQRGRPAFITLDEMGGRALYRVFAGYYTLREQVEADEEFLRSILQQGSMIVDMATYCPTLRPAEEVMDCREG